MPLICVVGRGAVAPRSLYPHPVDQRGLDDPTIFPHQHRPVMAPPQPHRPPPEAQARSHPLPPPPRGMQRPDKNMGACSRSLAYPLAWPPPHPRGHPISPHAFPTSHSSSSPRLCQTGSEGCSPPTASHEAHWLQAGGSQGHAHSDQLYKPRGPHSHPQAGEVDKLTYRTQKNTKLTMTNFLQQKAM